MCDNSTLKHVNIFDFRWVIKVSTYCADFPCREELIEISVSYRAQWAGSPELFMLDFN